jgi:glycerol-3-phosphate acyltransferase PlsY
MPDWSLILCGYLLGSIPFAFLVTRRHSGVDVRLSGSGNVGAANVLRVAGPSLGLTVLALDVAKGSTAVWIAQGAGRGEVTCAAVGLAAIVGHVYPVWLRFRGGRGVAVACGVFSMLAPLATAFALLVFTMVLWATRYVSLASVAATVTVPPTAYVIGASTVVVLIASVAALLIVARHRSNLLRIRAGTERRLGQQLDPLSHTR